MTVRLPTLHSRWMPLATENDPLSISGPVFLILLLGGGLVFGVGYLWAVMHRANKDYKATKAAVKALRKGFWTSWWNAMKAGMWVLVAFLVLLSWVIHDIRAQNNDATPKPSPSISTKARK